MYNTCHMVAHNPDGVNVFPAEIRPEKRYEALKMRRRGMSYPDIADKLGIALTTAYRYVQTEMKRLDNERRAEAEGVLAMELERLDRLLSAVIDKAEAGSLDHIDTVLRLSERRAKLLGLNAGIKHTVEVDDKRALPDIEVYKKTRALLERLAAAGHPVDKRLLERSPFDAVLEGQVLDGTAVKVPARAALSAGSEPNAIPGSPEHDETAPIDGESGPEPTPSDTNSDD